GNSADAIEGTAKITSLRGGQEAAGSSYSATQVSGQIINGGNELQVVWQADVTATKLPATLTFFTSNGTSHFNPDGSVALQKIYVFHYVDGAWKLEGSDETENVVITCDTVKTQQDLSVQYNKSTSIPNKGIYIIVTASDADGNVFAISKSIYIAPGGKNANVKAVKLNKEKVKLSPGESFKLEVTLKGGKTKASRVVRYESDNESVAKVTKNGKIKAVGNGVCRVYAYAANGVSAVCKVRVCE
ncbi:MAG: Ig-like domain-containing protein, partial [Butyrivibrio sp.]|nr:Ig-like domain-containing protein [Butyrivibrio sp.]